MCTGKIIKVKNMAKINKHLANLRKKTKSTSFGESQLVTEWIDTGDYGLNRIISGDIHKGIPSGKIVLFGGESSSGKSLMVAKIAVNALKEGYTRVFYFDSEGGALSNFIESEGADPEKVERILVGSIEEASVQILQVYEAIEAWQAEEPDAKFLCVLDSLGALGSNKFITDAVDKSKQVSDMGLSAKLKNALMRALPVPCAKTNTSILIVNHIYDDPAALHPTKIKQQGGGRGVQYMSHITVQCSKKLEKNDNAKSDGNAYEANLLKFFTTKNREVRPFFTSSMLVDFSKGIHKWFSIWEPALLYGFIEQHGGWYIVPSYSDKKLRKVELLTNDAIWETFLDDFNKKSIEDMSYGGTNITKTLEDIDEEDVLEDGIS